MPLGGSSSPSGGGGGGSPSAPLGRVACASRRLAMVLSSRRRPAAWRLAWWQQACRVDRLALLADLEMQLDALRVARAHLRDPLAATYHLILLHQQGLIVRVRGEVGVVV